MSVPPATNLLLAILENTDAGIRYTPVRLRSNPAVLTIALDIASGQPLADATARVLVATPMPSLRAIERSELVPVDWEDLSPPLWGIIHMSDALISCVTGLELAGWDDEASLMGHPLIVGLREQITCLCAAWALTLPAAWRHNDDRHDDDGLARAESEPDD